MNVVELYPGMLFVRALLVIEFIPYWFSLVV